MEDLDRGAQQFESEKANLEEKLQFAEKLATDLGIEISNLKEERVRFEQELVQVTKQHDSHLEETIREERSRFEKDLSGVTQQHEILLDEKLREERSRFEQELIDIKQNHELHLGEVTAREERLLNQITAVETGISTKCHPLFTFRTCDSPKRAGLGTNAIGRYYARRVGKNGSRK